MNIETMNKAEQYVQQIADALGVAAEHVYSIMVRQQIVEGIVWILFSLVIVVLGYRFCRFYSVHAKKVKDNTKGWMTTISEDVRIFVQYVFWLVYLIMVVAMFFIIPEKIAQLINPEYYAIREIMHVVTGR